MKIFRKIGTAGFFAALWLIIKTVYRFIKALLQLTAEVIVYLGLEFPFFYLLICGIMYLTKDFDLSTKQDLVLFLVGIAMSLACSLAITIKKIIFKPFMAFVRYRERRKRILSDSKKSQNDKINKVEEKIEEENIENNEETIVEEFPKVYFSAFNRTIKIYEYEYYYDIYRVFPDGREMKIDVKAKNIKVH